MFVVLLIAYTNQNIAKFAQSVYFNAGVEKIPREEIDLILFELEVFRVLYFYKKGWRAGYRKILSGECTEN